LALGVQRLLLSHGERYRTLGGKAFAARDVDLGPVVTRLLGALGLFYVLIALVLPYGTMIAVSLMKSIGNGFAPGNLTLDNFAVVLSDPAIRKALLLSLSLAAASATIVVVLGLLTSYVVVRTRLRGRFLLDYVS